MENYLKEEKSANVCGKIMAGTYKWMCAGLLITGVATYLTSFVIAAAPAAYLWVFILSAIAELGLVFYVSSKIYDMEYSTALSLLGIYSVLNGVTLSGLFLTYMATSLAGTFFGAAALFALMAAAGHYTSTDLSSFGKIMLYALIGLIIASVINIFFANSALYWICTYVGILIFVGLTAYDAQNLKRIAAGCNTYDDTAKKCELVCALDLYLDLINLFILLLRIFGDSK